MCRINYNNVFIDEFDNRKCKILTSNCKNRRAVVQYLGSTEEEEVNLDSLIEIPIVGRSEYPFRVTRLEQFV